MGSERPNLRFERSNLGSQRPNLRSERLNLRPGRPEFESEKIHRNNAGKAKRKKDSNKQTNKGMNG